MKTYQFYRLAAVMFSLCAMLVATTASANQFKRIRDINVSCNNALQCDLYITNARVTLYTVGLRRSGAQNAPVSIFLSPREALRSGSEVVFSVDGGEVLRLAVSDFSYRAALSEYTYGEEADVAKLIAAAKAGSALEIGYATRSGATSATFSLSGVVAGMIYMDEVQGRLGRADALGTVAATPDPVAQAGEGYREFETLDQVPVALRPLFEDGAYCSDFLDGPQGLFGSFETPVRDGMTLVGLRCGEGGAYNFPYSFFLLEDGQYRQIYLPVILDQGPAVTGQAWNISWNDETKVLDAFMKGRGIGDCGHFNRWIFEDIAGEPQFILKTARVKDDCDGVDNGWSEDGVPNWPVVWPVQ